MDRKNLLKGICVVEFAGFAPGPFCGLILADLGATVVRVDTLSSIKHPLYDILCRGKQSIAISAKVPAGRDVLLKLISGSDVVIDTYREGVLEALGLGPKVFLGEQGQNPRLVYARLAGFDPLGGYKGQAGHDLNFLAQSGVLAMMPPSNPHGRPSFPSNLVASMGGGALLCTAGILAGLFSLARSPTEKGMIIESDIVSGARYFSTLPLMLSVLPDDIHHSQPPGRGIADGGAPFYNVYQCADGKWIGVACYEPHFYKKFSRLIEENLGPNFTPPPGAINPGSINQLDRTQWKAASNWIQAAFQTRSQQAWDQIFRGTDACAVPVLTPSEAASIHGSEPTPHPHFSRPMDKRITPAMQSTDRQAFRPSILQPGTHTFQILHAIGMSNDEIAELHSQGALGSQVDQSLKAKL